MSRRRDEALRVGKGGIVCDLGAGGTARFSRDTSEGAVIRDLCGP